MAIDTSIYQALLRPAKSVAEYDNEALTLQQNRLALQMAQSTIADKSRAVEDGNRLRQAVSGFGSDTKENYNALLKAGQLKAAQDYQKTNADAAESEAKASKSKVDLIDAKLKQSREYLATVKTPEQYIAWHEANHRDPILGPELAARGVTAEQARASIMEAIQQPGGLEQLLQRSALGIEKFTEMNKPTLTTRDLGGTSQVLSTPGLGGAPTVLRSDTKTQSPDSVASNATSRANNAASVSATMRGQNMTDARTREATRGQIIQTDAGPMLANPLTGTARPVMGPDGAPIQAKLKPLPAPVQKAMMENDAALKKVNRALAEVAAYPEALGASNYLGDTVRQRTDPKGIAARALVADIGSLKIHDRSGAAVTAAEAPRLKPFIPAATDDSETVKKKLQMFKEEYESIQSDIQANYSQDQGYRLPGNKVAPSRVEPAPVAAKPPAKVPPATPPKNAKGWTLHMDAQGNRAYVSPDGKNFEEVK